MVEFADTHENRRMQHSIKVRGFYSVAALFGNLEYPNRYDTMKSLQDILVAQGFWTKHSSKEDKKYEPQVLEARLAEKEFYSPQLITEAGKAIAFYQKHISH